MYKKLSFLLLALSISILSFLPLLGLAWGNTGHRIVGEIAFRHLKPNAKKAVLQILHEPLATACTWADFVRSDPEFAKDGSFHYINVSDSLPFDVFKQTVLNADMKDNAVQKIEENINKLKKNPTDEIALRYLIHLVGDIHQPLHAGHKEDLGGNLVRIKWFGKNTNLHSLWDSGLIEFQELGYPEYTDYLLTINEDSKYEKKDPVVWAWESYKIVNGDIYPYGEIKNNFVYNYKFKKIMEDRLWVAGRRLADILNDLYK